MIKQLDNVTTTGKPVYGTVGLSRDQLVLTLGGYFSFVRAGGETGLSLTYKDEGSEITIRIGKEAGIYNIKAIISE